MTTQKSESKPDDKIDKEKAKIESLRLLASQYDFDANALEVHILLMHTSRKVAEVTEANLIANGVTRGRFIPLALLLGAKGKRMKPSDLAENCGVTRATMTGLLDSLEKDGHVRRVTQETDRRAMDIELTTKGEKFIRKLLPQHFKLISKLMSGVTEGDRKAVASACKKVMANIEKLK